MSCDRCEYAANVEKAEVGACRRRRRQRRPRGARARSRRRASARSRRSARSSRMPPDRFIKTLVYVADGRSRRGGARARRSRRSREAKLKDALGAPSASRSPTRRRSTRVTGAPVGFAGPVGLDGTRDRRRPRARAASRGAVTRRQPRPTSTSSASIRRATSPTSSSPTCAPARAGDRCPRCEAGTFGVHRGIEVGQVFYLGTKYSEAAEGHVPRRRRQRAPIEMGMLRHRRHAHDGRGDRAEPRRRRHRLADCRSRPSRCVDRAGERDRRERCATTAERLYDELEARGVDVAARRSRRAPGRQVQGRRSDRHSAARHRRPARARSAVPSS